VLLLESLGGELLLHQLALLRVQARSGHGSHLLGAEAGQLPRARLAGPVIGPKRLLLGRVHLYAALHSEPGLLNGQRVVGLQLAQTSRVEFITDTQLPVGGGQHYHGVQMVRLLVLVQG
jgi:hypothetical protein